MCIKLKKVVIYFLHFNVISPVSDNEDLYRSRLCKSELSNTIANGNVCGYLYLKAEMKYN